MRSAPLVLLSAALLAGCAPTNISELAKAMAGDQASVCVTVASVYGTVKIARSGLLNGTVSCSADGMSIRAKEPAEGPVKP